jgi:hypothetical protein
MHGTSDNEHRKIIVDAVVPELVAKLPETRQAGLHGLVGKRHSSSHYG